MSDLTMVRLSKSQYRIQCYSDKEQTTPLDLTDLPLLFVAKQKVADADSSIVFSLTIGNGLEIDQNIQDKNELIATISPTLTTSLATSKETSLYCELLITGAQRQTLGQLTIPVRPSIKQS